MQILLWIVWGAHRHRTLACGFDSSEHAQGRLLCKSCAMALATMMFAKFMVFWGHSVRVFVMFFEIMGVRKCFARPFFCKGYGNPYCNTRKLVSRVQTSYGSGQVSFTVLCYDLFLDTRAPSMMGRPRLSKIRLRVFDRETCLSTRRGLRRKPILHGRWRACISISVGVCVWLSW